jgi:trans-2,3-dihydro-3-hydroxyanthranilate isomerase
MTAKHFIIADVFTDRQFGGNQLAVFTDARGMDEATMQNIAREIGYSETTFLLPPREGGDFWVRIFTPERELPFAGHPCVGSGFVIVSENLKALKEPATTVTLETGVGPILVEVTNNFGRPGHTRMSQPLPQVRARVTEVERLAAALGIEAGSISTMGLLPEAIFNGIVALVVPVDSLATIERLQFDGSELRRFSKDVGADTVLIFSMETVEPSSTVHCRVAAPAAGVIEDAATGSANGPLGFYLVRHGLVPVTPTVLIVSEQGYEMKRPSKLHIEVDVDSSSGNAVKAVRVGGCVVISGRGEILLGNQA